MRRLVMAGILAGAWACSLAFPDLTTGDAGPGGGRAGGAVAGGTVAGGTVAGGTVAGGSAGGASAGGSAGGSFAGGSAGGAAGGSIAGGAAGGSIAGGAAGGAIAGGSAGGSIAGGSAGGAIAGGSVAGGCPASPVAPLLLCWDFESGLPTPAERLRAGRPSDDVTAEVILDGGRPGRVVRFIATPFSTSGTDDHGYVLRATLGARRKLAIELDVFTVSHLAGDQNHIVTLANGSGPTSLATDTGGTVIYSPAVAPLSNTSQGTTLGQWQHLVWHLNFDQRTSAATIGTTTVLDGGIGAATGSIDLLFGLKQYSFSGRTEVLYDNVTVRELP